MHALITPLLAGAALLLATSEMAVAGDGAPQTVTYRPHLSVTYTRPIVHRYDYHHAPEHYRANRSGHRSAYPRHFGHHGREHGRGDLRGRHYGYYDRHYRARPRDGGSTVFFLYRN